MFSGETRKKGNEGGICAAGGKGAGEKDRRNSREVVL